MSQAEATAWWTEVEELRERIERRRTLEADVPSAEPHPGAEVDEGRRPLAPIAAPSERHSEPAGSDRDLEPAPRRRSEHVSSPPAVEGTRRTVRIRGQAIPTVVAPRLRPADGQRDRGELTAEAVAPRRTRPYGTERPARPRPRPAERMGANPDRLAAWAFALALLTLLVAAISAHGL